ncbi:MAG TPA: hypothetical protein VF659_05700 [Pyrinomonadaceae bacterium]|jgi:hypothetical protein
MKKRMLKVVLTASALLLAAGAGPSAAARVGRWRAATEEELRKVLPSRAPVVKENIETEFRTASGVTDGRGRFIAGVVMITAGYSAEGLYSHYFVTQAPLRLGNLSLPPGQYVFGYKRAGEDFIRISFYRASGGEPVGEVDAHRGKGSLVRSLLISPPAAGRGNIRIGRFSLDFRVTD